MIDYFFLKSNDGYYSNQNQIVEPYFEETEKVTVSYIVKRSKEHVTLNTIR